MNSSNPNKRAKNANDGDSDDEDDDDDLFREVDERSIEDASPDVKDQK